MFPASVALSLITISVDYATVPDVTVAILRKKKKNYKYSYLNSGYCLQILVYSFNNGSVTKKRKKKMFAIWNKELLSTLPELCSIPTVKLALRSGSSKQGNTLRASTDWN